MNQKEALMKAGVLAEALPWLLKFQDCIVVIKFGGNAMVDKSLLHTFAQDVVFLRLAGLKPIVVHGGGPQITKRLEEKGIISEFKNGYRVTTSEVVGIVKDVLVNEIQKDIVNAINAMKSMAVGISGDEFDLIQVKKMMIDQTIDIGFVGDVERVDIKQIIEVLKANRKFVEENHSFMKWAFQAEAHAPAMLLGSLLAGLATVAMIGFVTRVSRVKEDTAIGIMYTGIFALGGMLASYFSDWVHIDLLHFVVGSVLSVEMTDLWRLGGVCVFVLGVIVLFYRPLQMTSFDPVMAASIGIICSSTASIRPA